MLAGDIAEGQGRTERDAGARIIAAHDARHVVADGMQPFDRDALPVENDIDAIFKLGLKVMAGNLAQHGEKLRHDPDATASVVVKLAQEGRRRKSAAQPRVHEQHEALQA